MKKNRKVTGVVALVVFLLLGRAWSARAANEEASPVAAADVQIISEIKDHSELMDNLEYLSDRIGPRLTGSSQLKQANDWTAEMFRKYGLTNVHLEPYTIPHAWTRGTAKARIIAPAEHPLTIAAAAWAPSTRGTVRGQVARGHRNLSGPTSAFAAKDNRCKRRDLPPNGGAASACGATSASGSL